LCPYKYAFFNQFNKIILCPFSNLKMPSVKQSAIVAAAALFVFVNYGFATTYIKQNNNTSS